MVKTLLFLLFKKYLPDATQRTKPVAGEIMEMSTGRNSGSRITHSWIVLVATSEAGEGFVGTIHVNALPGFESSS
jgi:hypothetical protein